MKIANGTQTFNWDQIEMNQVDPSINESTDEDNYPERKGAPSSPKRDLSYQPPPGGGSAYLMPLDSGEDGGEAKPSILPRQRSAGGRLKAPGKTPGLRRIRSRNAALKRRKSKIAMAEQIPRIRRARSAAPEASRISVPHMHHSRRSSLHLPFNRHSSIYLYTENSYIGYTQEAPLRDLVCAHERSTDDHTDYKPRGNEELLEEADAELDKEQTWFALFTDLIFVAVIFQLANNMKGFSKGFYAMPYGERQGHDVFLYHDTHNAYCKSDTFSTPIDHVKVTMDGIECIKRGGLSNMHALVIESMLYYFAFFVVWLELSSGLGRFVNIDGWADDVLWFFYCMFLVCMTTQIYNYDAMAADTLDSFSIFVATTLGVLLMIHMLYYYRIPQARFYCRRRIWAYFVAILFICVGAGVFELYASSILLFMGLLIVFYVSLTGFLVQPQTNLTLDFFIERFGILVMLTTGETILALIVNDPDFKFDNQNAKHVSTIFLAFFLAYGLKGIYFQADAPERLHALTKTGFPGPAAWVVLHYFLCYSLLWVGVGFKLMFYLIANYDAKIKDDYVYYGYILTVALSAVLLLVDLIRSLHPKWLLRHPLSFACRIVPIAMLPIGVLVSDQVLPLQLWCCVWCYLHLGWDFIGADIFNEVNPKALSGEGEHGHGHHGHHHHEHHHQPTEADHSVGNKVIGKGHEMEEWREGGFMGPKMEMWPPYLIADVVKGETERAYMRVLEYEPPNEHVRHEDTLRDWLMEFTDLIFVAIIYKFADQMKNGIKYEFNILWVFIESFTFFGCFFTLWLELVCEFVRFGNMPGIADDWLRFIYLCGLVGMAAQMDDEEYLTYNRRGFIIFFTLSLAATFLLHLMYLFRGLKSAERYIRWRLMAYGIMIFFNCLTLIEGMNYYWHSMGTLLMNMCFMLYVSGNSFRVQDSPEIQREVLEKAEADEEEMGEPIEEHFIERFGLFVMICSGETILALIVNFQTLETQPATYASVIIAFAMMYFFKFLYMSAQAVTEAVFEYNAFKQSKVPGSVCFVLIHFLLGYCVLGIGVGWKLVFYKLSTNSTVKQSFRAVLGLALTCAVILITISRYTHGVYLIRPSSLARAPIIFSLLAVFLWIEEAPLAAIIATGAMAVMFALDRQFFDEFEHRLVYGSRAGALRDPANIEPGTVLPWERSLRNKEEHGHGTPHGKEGHHFPHVHMPHIHLPMLSHTKNHIPGVD